MRSKFDVALDKLDNMENYIEGQVMKRTAAWMTDLQLLHNLIGENHAMVEQSLKAGEDKHASLAEHVKHSETVFGGSSDKLEKALDVANQRLDQLNAACTESSSLAKRIEYVEKVSGESADQTTRLLSDMSALQHDVGGMRSSFDVALDKLENMESSIEGQVRKRTAAWVADLQDVRTLIGEQHSMVETSLKVGEDKHASLAERMESYIEGQVAKRTAAWVTDLQDLHTLIGEHHAMVEKSLKAGEDKHSSLAEHVKHSETVFGASADKHGKALEIAQQRLDQLSTAWRDSSSLAKRVEYLETVAGDSADQHAGEILALKDAHSKHAKDYEDLKASHACFASVTERLDCLEKRLGESADVHGSDLRTLRMALDKHRADQARHSKDLDALKSSHALQSALSGRVEKVEKLLGDSTDRHAADLETLREAHAAHEALHNKYARDIDSLRVGCAHHSTLGERLRDLEASLTDLADRLAAQLEEAFSTAQGKAHSAFKAASAEHATLAQRVESLEEGMGSSAVELNALKVAHTKHEKAFGKHVQDIEDLRAAHEDHIELRERLDHVEKLLGDSAKSHAAQLETLAKSQGEQASMPRRLKALEKRLGDAVNQHAAELETLQVAHDKHFAAHGKLVKDLDASKAALAKLATDLEAVKSAHDKHGKDLDVSKTVLAQYAADLEALQGAHDTHHMGHGRHTKDLDTIKATLAQYTHISERVTDLENSAQAHKVAHAKYAKDLTVLQAAQVTERVESLERMLNASGHERRDELQALRLAFADELDTLKASCIQHATISERLGTLRKVLSESTENHEEAIRKQAEELECLKATHSMQTRTIAEIMDRVEKLVRDSDDTRTRQATELTQQISRTCQKTEKVAVELQDACTDIRRGRSQHEDSPAPDWDLAFARMRRKGIVGRSERVSN